MVSGRGEETSEEAGGLLSSSQASASRNDESDMNSIATDASPTKDRDKEYLENLDDNGMKKKEEKLPYPKAIWFIVGNEFCERFSFYGMKTILYLYITEKLHYSADATTAIYHGWSAATYFMPIFGAIIADSWLGKYKTIWIISLLYILGHLLKTLAAITPLGVPPAEFSFLGLALIAIGTGGIKPCVSAFGGDQFKLPEQEHQLQTFFSVFYFSINAGSLISTILTPALRQDVHCFGDDSCYSLAFGVPAALMAIATVILIIGKPFYKIVPPQGTVITTVLGSVWLGLFGKIKSLFGKAEKKEHWLDHAKSKYSEDLVDDTKKFMKVLKIFIPIPFFWALFDQTGTRWTARACKTTGELGNTFIKPDQMQVVNPLLILFLIPVFDRIIYPQFAKIGLLKNRIHRIFVGGLLTGLAFFIMGFLDLALEPANGIVPHGHESHLHIMNSLDCVISVKVPDMDYHGGIESRASEIIQGLEPGQDFAVTVKSGGQEPEHCRTYAEKTIVFKGEAEKTTEYVIRDLNGQLDAVKIDQPAKPNPKSNSKSNPMFRLVLAYDGGSDATVRLDGTDDESNIHFENITDSNGVGVTGYKKLYPQSYEIWVSDLKLDETNLRQGGVYSGVVTKDDDGKLHLHRFILTAENTVHMLWMIPQYVALTCGEIMVSITGLEFSYSQAPQSMKSMVQACWLLTVAFGNVFDAVIAGLHLFSSEHAESFFFGGLIVVVITSVLWLGKDFKYAGQKDEESTEEISMDEKSK